MTGKDEQDIKNDTKSVVDDVKKASIDVKWVTLNILGPLALTLLSFYVRFYHINANKTVVWDEAHFGKFGSYYIKHEFYHDVHPPLGKMLIGLSEWLAGFDGQFDFDSNTEYPPGVNFKLMRQFNATFGALCVPVAFFTCHTAGFDYWITYLLTLMVALEHSYIALSKFILLDSMLLFFTMTTFACMVKVHTLRQRQFTRSWSWWMLLTGLSIGCVISTKWVGLFTTAVVGLYTCIDLWTHHCDVKMSTSKYLRHWLIRIIDLIIIPFLIYMFCFQIHFKLLYKSGTGDASTNSLFQINLENNQIEIGPRNVVVGSEVTIRSHGLSPNLLHSHIQKYPKGSQQNQVTGYGHSDSNNRWIFKLPAGSYNQEDDTIYPIVDGTEIRLYHKNTGHNLHSHEIPSHVSRGSFEVSGYGSDTTGDPNDYWIIELVQQLPSSNPKYPKEDPNILHPISTFFRLRHKELGCYLTSTGFSYPSWGFKQSEIVCKHSWSKRDKSTWWNVEDHWNENLDIDDDYRPPKSRFWTDFVLINFAMAASNNALIPDDDKYDNLASEAWEWPTLHKGLRMCNWSRNNFRYYLMGSPFNTWLSTLSLFAFILILFRITFQWGRQSIHLTENKVWNIVIQGIIPFISWLAHYLPFVTMGRVTYVHHYVPALYFAILVFGFVLQETISKAKSFIRYTVYVILFGSCIYTYLLFAPICQGMTGYDPKLSKLEWLSSWDIL